jgi:hypothetical protein
VSGNAYTNGWMNAEGVGEIDDNPVLTAVNVPSPDAQKIEEPKD